MEGGNSDDWLPPGWRMEIKLRKFGRKDKHYYAPSGQKLYSKLEVLRHLKNNLLADSPRLEEGKDGCGGSPQTEKAEQVSLHRGATDECNNGDSCSPASVEKGKISPDISTYFSCNSMDSSSLVWGEDNQVIEQHVEIHDGEAPNIDCLLPQDGKFDVNEAAITISGESQASKLLGENNRILHLSIGNYCAKNLEEDSASKEAWTLTDIQSLVGETGRADQSSSPVISQKKNSRHQNHARTNVVVEKCVAEGLPMGWTKEIKVTKKNGNVRRDPYYTDPTSGYVFRSMKDVLRYLKTGDIGRLAFKPKDKSSSELELEDGETPVKERGAAGLSPLTEKQKLATPDNKEGMEDLPEKVVVMPSSCQREELSVPECAPHKKAKVISEEPLHKKLRQNGECDACPPEVAQYETTPVEGKSKDCEPCPQNITHFEDIPEQSLPSAEEKKDPTPKSNVKRKATSKPRKIKEINTPRRISSRLAGIAVDPTVEIPSRASRGNAKHIQEAHSQMKTEMPNREVLRVASSHTSNDKDNLERNSHLIGVATHNGDNGSTENKMAEKCVLPFELPSPEILQDPCIEFAIKTLTGMIDFSNLDDAFQPRNGMSTKSVDCTKANSETEKHVSQKQGVGTVMSQKTPIVPEEPAPKPITEETTANMPCSSALESSWSDPCIEFAIKTLTGAIPVDYGPGMQGIFRHEMHPPQIPGSGNGPVPNSVGPDNFGRTDLPWQQSAENPMNRGRDGLIPPENRNMLKSGISIGHRQHSDRGANQRFGVPGQEQVPRLHLRCAFVGPGTGRTEANADKRWRRHTTDTSSDDSSLNQVVPQMSYKSDKSSKGQQMILKQQS
ncbi:hypothetical protein MLD38_025669 [Melastoma candidum]|uniref:Uncharacterized protein n=1 Tax=Melastoma candidum TaxID=119954 RepID=A0ACB9NXW5_9MYRT|nr:hypothetical protein MLD38_025669 [Melastoma candidum]